MEANERINQSKIQHAKEVDSNRPALFQKNARHEPSKDWRQEEYEAWKKLQEEIKMDFNPDDKSYEELRDFFRVPKDKNILTDMNERMFDNMFTRLKERQISHYAFLNKEFNTMNYKSARCSMHCYDSTARPMSQVSQCLKVCRQGIHSCKEFAFQLQKESEAELNKCVKKASD